MKIALILTTLLLGNLAWSGENSQIQKSKRRHNYKFKISSKEAQKKEPLFSKAQLESEIKSVKVDARFLKKIASTRPDENKPDIVMTANSNRLRAGSIRIGNVRCPVWTNGWADDGGQCGSNTSKTCGDTPIGIYKVTYVGSAKGNWVLPYSFGFKPKFRTKRDRLFIHSRGYTKLRSSQWVDFRSSGCPVLPPKCMEALKQVAQVRGKAGLIVQLKEEGFSFASTSRGIDDAI